MNLNLNHNERKSLGEANLDTFFDHLNFLVDNPEEIKTIPKNSTIVYKEAVNDWVNTQNDLLAKQAESKGENVHRVSATEKFSMTFPDGRKFIFNTNYLWTTNEVSLITGLTIYRILSLEKEKIVPSLFVDKRFDFSQVLQLQAYWLITKSNQPPKGFGQKTNFKKADLQKLLKFYADYKLKAKALDHFPVLFDGQIFSIAPNMSGSEEFLSILPSLDWKSQSVRTATIHPPLLEVMKQLCENAWKLRDSQVWTQKELEEKLMVAA